MQTSEEEAEPVFDPAAVAPNGVKHELQAQEVSTAPQHNQHTLTADTQQQLQYPAASQDGASTPSASGMSGPCSSQGTKTKGRSGPKSKHSPFIGVSQYKRTGRWEVRRLVQILSQPEQQFNVWPPHATCQQRVYMRTHACSLRSIPSLEQEECPLSYSAASSAIPAPAVTSQQGWRYLAHPK
jgi:hypothetical protein